MFEIAGKEDLPEMKARRPKRAPSGFMEGLTASFKAEQMETDAWHRVAKTRASVFEDIEKSLMQKAGGKAVIEEAPNPKHRTNPTADRMKSLMQKAGGKAVRGGAESEAPDEPDGGSHEARGTIAEARPGIR